MQQDSLEKAHKANIESLIEDFGKDKEEEITQIYNQEKEFLENKAKIKDFIPMFSYRVTKEHLLTRYKPLQRK